MTIEKAFSELLATSQYKDICKQRDGIGGKYRTYKKRFEDGQLKAGAMVEMLIAHGYTVEVLKGKAQRKKPD